MAAFFGFITFIIVLYVVLSNKTVKHSLEGATKLVDNSIDPLVGTIVTGVKGAELAASEAFMSSLKEKFDTQDDATALTKYDDYIKSYRDFLLDK